jgi:Secretin and TonB N terminus short domain
MPLSGVGLERGHGVQDKRQWRLWCYLRCTIACFILSASGLATLIKPAAAAENGPTPGPSTDARAFNIPSQPLEDALYAFDAATGIEVFVDGHAVAGRKSTAVKGVFTSEQALRALLNGTGLDAKRIGADTITVFRDDRPPAPPGSALYHAYSAFVQTAIVHALCGRPEARPGGYRVALRLWLDPSGIVSHADLLSSTGDSQRDSRIHDILSRISVGVAPPTKLPQPIVMVILPRRPPASGDCSQ